MATKKKSKTAAKKTVAKKKIASARKITKKTGSARKVKVLKKVQKKRQTKRKIAEKKTKKVSGPAKKTIRKKVKGKTSRKVSAGRIEQKKKKPLSKDRARRTPVSAVSPMSARKELLKQQLIKKREEIVREAKTEIAKYITGEANQLVETALDDGDWSVIDLSADINLRRLETHRERLLGIDAALMKLREGTYGVCEECGGEITPERLNVMPFAIYCRDCQEKKEQLEKIAREEVIT